MGHYRWGESMQSVRESGCSFMVVGVPWAMIESHWLQAEKNHQQSLAVLRSRGGLSACEMLAVLEDRPWRAMEYGEANLKLVQAINAWCAKQAS